MVRVDELDKGMMRFIFRAYEQVKVGKHMQRKCYELYGKSEEEVLEKLKMKLEKSVDTD